VTQRSETLTATKRAATRDREALELRMVAVEKRYRAQFSALDSLLSGMQSTSGFLAQRLG
jgi:flagellar hook-associated protein 2